MAEFCSEQQEEVTSPIPRAPPPSPEMFHHQSIDQFDFMALLSTASLKKKSSPSSSTEHSGPSSPLFYPSPERNQLPSGSVSPSDHTHSDASISFSSKLSELSLGNNNCYQEMVNGPQKLFSGSLPVNGDFQHYKTFMSSQQEVSDIRSETSGQGRNEGEQCTGERRRKISLKRQHNDQEEFSYDNRSPGIEIIHKKVCHENEFVGSAPIKSRRSNTFSGTVSRPSILNNNHLSVHNDGSDFHVGSLPGSHMTSLVTSSSLPKDQTTKSSSGCLSPIVSRTVGFSTSGMGNTDEQQMEGIEMQGEEPTPPPNIPISVMDTTDWSNRGLTLTSNVMQTDSTPSSSFSFAIPSSQSLFNPSPLSYRLNVPGSTGFSSNEFTTTTGSLTGQQQQQQLHVGSVPQITLSSYSFSKSV